MKIEINYPPNFKSRYGYGHPKAKFIEAIFNNNIEQQISFLSEIHKFGSFLSKISLNELENSENARWNQPWFPPLDGISMYTMMASNKPEKYIEIGSGNSTKFAAQSIRDQNLTTEIISIDPHPRAEIDSICDRVIREPLEDVSDFDSILLNLKPNDIVFFDGSHRCFQNSDVTSFFIDYLPIIPAGVIIGVHDIFWPNDYPEHWIERYYNEQYILAAYILAHGDSFPLLFSCSQMASDYNKKIREVVPPELLKSLMDCGRGIGGGALWFKKPDTKINI